MKLWKLMMTGIVALGLAGVATVEPGTVTAHASDGISIDGNFSDWSGVNKAEGNNLNESAVASYGQHVYVYVAMRYGQVPGYGDYQIKVGGREVHAYSDNIPNNVKEGERYSFTLTGGNGNNGRDYQEVGNGYVMKKNDHWYGEFQLDLAKYKFHHSVDGKPVSVSNPSIGGTATNYGWCRASLSVK